MLRQVLTRCVLGRGLACVCGHNRECQHTTVPPEASSGAELLGQAAAVHGKGSQLRAEGKDKVIPQRRLVL